MYPCSTGVKALFDPSECTGTGPSSEVTDIPLTDRQRLKDDHLSIPFEVLESPTGDRTQ